MLKAAELRKDLDHLRKQIYGVMVSCDPKDLELLHGAKLWRRYGHAVAELCNAWTDGGWYQPKAQAAADRLFDGVELASSGMLWLIDRELPSTSAMRRRGEIPLLDEDPDPEIERELEEEELLEFVQKTLPNVIQLGQWAQADLELMFDDAGIGDVPYERPARFVDSILLVCTQRKVADNFGWYPTEELAGRLLRRIDAELHVVGIKAA